MSLINIEKIVLNRTIKNSVSLINKEKDKCWKFQKFKWKKFQIVIVFCFHNWWAIDLLKEIIMNIYNFFVFIEIFTNFRDHFVFFCKFVIYHSICILWFDNNHSTAKYLNSFHSNNNFSKYFLCTDCHKKEIIYHRRRYRNFLQFIFSSLSVETKCISLFET